MARQQQAVQVIAIGPDVEDVMLRMRIGAVGNKIVKIDLEDNNLKPRHRTLTKLLLKMLRMPPQQVPIC